MSETKAKLYRRKEDGEYKVLDRWFEGDVPWVNLALSSGYECDLKMPYTRFLDDFKEVPVGDVPEVPMDIAAPHRVLSYMLKGRSGFDAVEAKCGDGTARLAARELQDLLDAARKSLAGGDADEPAERCRVGEWLPGKRLLSAIGLGVPACCDYIQRNGLVHFVAANVGMTCTVEDWDAARAKWIADGRPTS